MPASIDYVLASAIQVAWNGDAATQKAFSNRPLYRGRQDPNAAKPYGCLTITPSDIEMATSKSGYVNAVGKFRAVIDIYAPTDASAATAAEPVIELLNGESNFSLGTGTLLAIHYEGDALVQMPETAEGVDVWKLSVARQFEIQYEVAL